VLAIDKLSELCELCASAVVVTLVVNLLKDKTWR
jgi:hypothetical protein